MDQKRVGFTIDAGLIQRLGYELVGRAETAVSELIKNAYDADARKALVFYLFLLDFFQIFAEEIAFFHIYGLNTGIGCQSCTVLE